MGTRQVGSAGTSRTGGAGPAGRTRCVSKASATASSDLQRAGHVATRPVGPAQQTGPPAGGKTTSRRERRAKRRAAGQRDARTAKQTDKQTNKQTNGPTGNDGALLMAAARARARACTSVRGCVGGRGVRVPLRARFSRRGALQCIRLFRGARDFTSPDAIGGVRRRRGRILHRHTPRRCACARACVCVMRVCARASVGVCARACERERERESVCRSD
jgi:hypothetical protein